MDFFFLILILRKVMLRDISVFYPNEYYKYERERERERQLPVNSETIVSLILDINIYGVPFCYTNDRSWETVIHNQHALGFTQPSKVSLLQLHEQMKNKK